MVAILTPTNVTIMDILKASNFIGKMSKKHNKSKNQALMNPLTPFLNANNPKNLRNPKDQPYFRPMLVGEAELNY
uniref:Uncharacterized protein n=1 Tax=Strongyloides papillosus TaxID=174720 RepID=A0A0N5BEU0_STREA